jgi:hypothetical protein
MRRSCPQGVIAQQRDDALPGVSAMAAAWPWGQRETSGTWRTQEVGRDWQVSRVPVHRRRGYPPRRAMRP